MTSSPSAEKSSEEIPCSTWNNHVKKSSVLKLNCIQPIGRPEYVNLEMMNLFNESLKVSNSRAVRNMTFLEHTREHWFKMENGRLQDFQVHFALFPTSPNCHVAIFDKNRHGMKWGFVSKTSTKTDLHPARWTILGTLLAIFDLLFFVWESADFVN